jgi:exopolyphosphatase/pppGpp-phosphohydrolase
LGNFYPFLVKPILGKRISLSPIERWLRGSSIDVGSNTIRLLIAEPEVSAPLRPIQIQRRITRLGENFLPNRILQPEAMDRSVAALKEFVELMGHNGVSAYSAGATAVVREASNGSNFLDLVQVSACSVVLRRLDFLFLVFPR